MTLRSFKFRISVERSRPITRANCLCDLRGGRCITGTDTGRYSRDTGAAVDELRIIEVKAFVPSRDFARSRQFYQDLGFELAWSSDDLAYLRRGASSFLLQNFYKKEHADNFMMHLLVEDVDAWRNHVEAKGLTAKYRFNATPPP